MQAEFDRTRQTKPNNISQQEAKGKRRCSPSFKLTFPSHAAVAEDTVTIYTIPVLHCCQGFFHCHQVAFPPSPPPILFEEKSFDLLQGCLTLGEVN